MSLSNKTSAAIGWSALERFTNQGAFFVIQIVLARLIDPSEFGPVQLASIFLLYSKLVIDGGFAQALIQKRDVTPDDISTVFYFNIVTSAIAYLGLFVAAPWIATFFNEPQLTLIVRVLSINLIIQSAGMIQSSLLTKSLEFRRLFKISTPSVILGGAVGIVMASLDFGVWALVASQIATTAIATTCYWIFTDRSTWPNWRFSWASLKSMSRFGTSMLSVSLMYEGVQNLYGLLVGKYFDTTQLAFYQRARSFHRTPAVALTSVLNRVLFPVFSTIQDDDARIVSALRRGIPVLSFVVFPLMVLLMTSAEHVVVWLLTDKWLPSVPLMRWFPIVGMVSPLASIQLSVLRAKGRAGLFFWLSLFRNLVAIVVLCLTISHGILAVAVGQAILAVVMHLLTNIPISARVFGYRSLDQLADVIPSLVLTGVAALAGVVAANMTNFQSHFILLMIQATVMVGVYLSLAHVLGLRGYRELKAAVRARFRTLAGNRAEPGQKS